MYMITFLYISSCWVLVVRRFSSAQPGCVCVAEPQEMHWRELKLVVLDEESQVRRMGFVRTDRTPDWPVASHPAMFHIQCFRADALFDVLRDIPVEAIWQLHASFREPHPPSSQSG
jgi:hypothetical protein